MNDLRRGRITLEEFAAYEARRAMNQQRDNWKKSPWLPGKTIDLGEHEWPFQQESGLAHYSDPVAPAVLDWLRWKYRRLQIDRRRDAEWARVLREEYPRRVERAGAPKIEDLVILEQHAASASMSGSISALWAAGGRVPFSRRQNLDLPKPVRSKPAMRLAHPRKRKGHADRDDQEIAILCARHGPLLKRLFERCRDDAEKHSVVAALYEYDKNPQDAKAVTRWAETVRVLNSSGR